MVAARIDLMEKSACTACNDPVIIHVLVRVDDLGYNGERCKPSDTACSEVFAGAERPTNPPFQWGGSNVSMFQGVTQCRVYVPQRGSKFEMVKVRKL